MKKKKVISVLLSAAMLLGLAGCMSEPGTAPVPKASEPTPASQAAPAGNGALNQFVDVLKIGTTKPANSFNIMTEDGSYGKMNYNAFCAAPFLAQDEQGKATPFIMTSWEIAGDQETMTATFATDQGISWHDGVPLTIDDVIFSFDYCTNVRKSSYTTMLKSVEKIDDTTAKFSFNGPTAFGFLNKIIMSVYVYPKHIWENIEDFKGYAGEDAAVGCGPYKLSDIDQDAQVVTFEAVGDSYMGRELTVKKVMVRSYDGHDALVMALKNGEVDAMYDYSNSLDSSMRPSITNVEGLDPGMSINTGNFQLVFGFAVDPTKDLAFRQAVAAALDYPLLATTIGGEDGEVAGTGIISPVVKGFDASLPKNQQDVEKAKLLLEDAGYTDRDGDGYRELPSGEPMEILVTPQYNQTRSALYLRIAEIIMQNLDKVGVKTKLDEESVRNSDYNTEFRKSGQYELYIGYTSPGVAQYSSAFMYMVPNPANPWGTCTIQEFNDTYAAMTGSSSYDEYNENIQKLQKMAGDEAVGIGLCWDRAYFPYRTDRYEGWINYPGFGVINPETWYNVRPIQK